MNELSRRTFLKSTIGVMALSTQAFSLAIDTKSEDKTFFLLDRYNLIYEHGIKESEYFGSLLKVSSKEDYLVENDVSKIWYELFNQEKLDTIIGMGSYESFFVLEKMANDKGMRTIFKSSHANARDNMIEHNIEASYPMLKLIRKNLVNEDSQDWIKSVADILKTTPYEKIESKDKFLTKSDATLDKTLYTWVIAPKIN